MEPQPEAPAGKNGKPQGHAGARGLDEDEAFRGLLGGTGAGRLLRAGAARRDFAALLEVARDDTLRLVAGGFGAARRRGLRAKIRSALGVLALSARTYLQSDARAEEACLKALARATSAMRGSNWPRVAAALSALCRAYPLSLAGLRPDDVTPAAAAAAGRTYHARCATCHRSAPVHSALAAPDLMRWARIMPTREFVARMIDGVHGTAFTSFENPLSNADIAAFYAYLKRAGAPACVPDGHVSNLLRHSSCAAR